MLVLLWSMQCLVVCVLTIEVCQQSFCTFCVVRGQVALHLLLLVDVSSKKLLWFARFEVADVLE